MVSQGKAVAAAGFGRPSGAVPADSPVIQAILATQGGRMVPAQQDEDCARAGMEAL